MFRQLPHFAGTWAKGPRVQHSPTLKSLKPSGDALCVHWSSLLSLLAQKIQKYTQVIMSFYQHLRVWRLLYPKTPPTKHLCTAPYLILPGLSLSPPTQPNPESTQPCPASLGRRAAKLQTWWLLQSSTSLGAISITCGWHGSFWSKPTHVNSCLYPAIDVVGNSPSAK